MVGRMYSEPENVPVGYGDDIELGRPEEKSTNRNTQDDNFGKDRLGTKGMNDKDNENDSLSDVDLLKGVKLVKDGYVCLAGLDIVTGKQIGRASCRERVLRLV